MRRPNDSVIMDGCCGGGDGLVSGLLLSSSPRRLGAVALTAFLRREGLERSDQWSSVIFGAVGVLSAVVALVVWLWQRGAAHPAPSTSGQVETAVQDLARAQAEQWGAERVARYTGSPYPLPVSWAVTMRAAASMASWSAIDGRPGATGRRLHGSYGEIANVFADVGITAAAGDTR